MNSPTTPEDYHRLRVRIARIHYSFGVREKPCHHQWNSLNYIKTNGFRVTDDGWIMDLSDGEIEYEL